MPRYQVEVIYHEEKDETYFVIMGAEGEDAAKADLQRHIDYPLCHPSNIAGATLQSTTNGDCYAEVGNVVLCPEEPDPNQLALL